MTQPPEDQPTLWLKQVPNNRINDEGVWSDKLLENHRTVRRSSERPRRTVDDVTLSQLIRAAEEFLRKNTQKGDPELDALRLAESRFTTRVIQEREGNV